MNDKDVILAALQKERDELHSKIMQVDRIMKRITDIGLVNETNDTNQVLNIAPIIKSIQQRKPISQGSNMKLIVLRVFDIIGHACTLKDIQTEYNKVSDNTYNVRESVRSLHGQQLLKMVKDKVRMRGFAWVKTDWLIDGELAEKHKPEGFDLLYPPDTVMFE